MTDNVKHSTSYFHEAIANAFEMFKNGYEPVMGTPFQPRRLGSAFVTEYKLVRESLDFPEMTKEKSKSISENTIKAYIEAYGDKNKQLTIQEKWEIDSDMEFDEFLKISKHRTKELFDRIEELRDKAEANREREEALNELAAQSQELGIYDKDNGIFDQLVESIESAQNNPEGCVSTIVEVDNERVKVYSKNELDQMHWNELKPILDAAGIRGRRRANLIRDFLKKQEERSG